jgi:hypothetical protein
MDEHGAERRQCGREPRPMENAIFSEGPIRQAKVEALCQILRNRGKICILQVADFAKLRC